VANVAQATPERMTMDEVRRPIDRVHIERHIIRCAAVSSGSVGNFGLDFRWRIEFD
jgi:hypothetical protein